MKICSKEMAAIVFGAGAPSGFTSSFGSPVPQQWSAIGSDTLSSSPRTASAGGAAAGTILGNLINGDGSFQNVVATLAGTVTAWGVEVGVLVATRSPGVALVAGTTAGTATTNYVNSLEAPGAITPVSGVGPQPPANTLEWNTHGSGSMSGGSEAGERARDGMGFGGTGSGITNHSEGTGDGYDYFAEGSENETEYYSGDSGSGSYDGPWDLYT